MLASRWIELSARLSRLPPDRYRFGRTQGNHRVSSRLVLACILLLSACGVPDYTAVRDWARTASFAANYPPVATAPAGRAAPSADRAALGAGILAMEQALSVYLAALGTIASDGVLPYREDPFAGLGPRIAPVSEPGQRAVASLGQSLRRATLDNAQAPQTRDTITANDAAVQDLVRALSAAVAALAPFEEEARRDGIEAYARMQRQAGSAPARVMVREVGATLDREHAVRAAARARYIAVLTGIGEGHALLKARTRRITRTEAIEQIRAAEESLRRAAAMLPRTLAPQTAADAERALDTERGPAPGAAGG